MATSFRSPAGSPGLPRPSGIPLGLGRKGWIAPISPGRTRGRRRVAFRLTPSGIKAFLSWLRRPPTQDDVSRDMDALVLRFTFMSQALESAELERFLEALRDHLGTHLRGLEAFIASAGPEMPLSGRLAFESGLEGVRGQLRWTWVALRQVTGGGETRGERR